MKYLSYLTKALAFIIKNFKNVVIGVFLIALFVAGYRIYNDYQDKNRLYQDLIGKEEAYKQLSETHAQLATKYKAQEELLKEANSRWSEVVKEKDERIKLLSDATFLIGQHYLKTQGPDYFFETPQKTRNYVFNEVRLEGEDSPPIGFVMIKNDGRTYKGTYPFEIRVESMQTLDENTGKIRVFSKAYLVSKENGLADKRRPDFKKWEGVQYPLKIVGGNVLVDPTVQNPLRPKWYLFNPKVDLSVSGGYDAGGFKFLPGIDVSLMSWGKTRNDSKFKFLGIGANFGVKKENLDINIRPIYWRPFDFFSSTYIIPSVGYSMQGMRYILGVAVEL